MIKLNKNLLKPAVLAVFAATYTSVSAASVIAYNFTERWHAKTIQGEGTVYGTDQWTDSIDYATAANGNVAANSTDPFAVTTPFNAPGVSVSWSSAGMYQAGDEGGALENQLFRRYLDDTTGVTISVAGLGAWLASEGAIGYKVTFYQNSNTASTDFAQMDLHEGVGTGGTLLESMGVTPNDGSGNGGGSRLIRTATSTFTADTITFDTDRDRGGTGRASISGFKIEAVAVPEPSSAALLGLGGLALILRRRK